MDSHVQTRMYRLACTDSHETGPHVQIYSCCACSDFRGGATPHTPAAAAAAAAAAADLHVFDSS